MAYEDLHHITAGLPVAKDSGQDPADEGQYHDVFYITAGLAAEVEAAPPVTGIRVSPIEYYYRRKRAG